MLLGSVLSLRLGRNGPLASLAGLSTVQLQVVSVGTWHTRPPLIVYQGVQHAQSTIMVSLPVLRSILYRL